MPGKHVLPKDLTGLVFNNLTVLGPDNERSTKSDKYWWCRCVCGTEKSVSRGNLTTGKVKSCGCLKAALNSVEKPPRSHSRLYFHWRNLQLRLGGCGLCNEWLDFNQFRIWSMNAGYTDKRRMSLMCKDKSQPFGPDNCYWAAYGLRPTSDTVPFADQGSIYVYRGVKGTIQAWSKLLGVNRTTLLYRVISTNGSLACACDAPMGSAKKDINLDAAVDNFLDDWNATYSEEEIQQPK